MARHILMSTLVVSVVLAVVPSISLSAPAANYIGPLRGSFSFVGAPRSTILSRYGTPEGTQGNLGGQLRWIYSLVVGGTRRGTHSFAMLDGQTVSLIEWECRHAPFPKPSDVPCGTVNQIARQENIALAGLAIRISMDDPRQASAARCYDSWSGGSGRSGNYWVSFRTPAGALHVIHIDLTHGGAPPYTPYIWKPITKFNPSTGLHETRCEFIRSQWRTDPERTNGSIQWWVSR